MFEELALKIFLGVHELSDLVRFLLHRLLEHLTHDLGLDVELSQCGFLKLLSIELRAVLRYEIAEEGLFGLDLSLELALGDAVVRQLLLLISDRTPISHGGSMQSAKGSGTRRASGRRGVCALARALLVLCVKGAGGGRRDENLRIDYRFAGGTRGCG